MANDRAADGYKDYTDEQLAGLPGAPKRGANGGYQYGFRNGEYQDVLGEDQLAPQQAVTAFRQKYGEAATGDDDATAFSQMSGETPLLGSGQTGLWDPNKSQMMGGTHTDYNQPPAAQTALGSWLGGGTGGTTYGQDASQGTAISAQGTGSTFTQDGQPAPPPPEFSAVQWNQGDGSTYDAARDGNGEGANIAQGAGGTQYGQDADGGTALGQTGQGGGTSYGDAGQGGGTALGSGFQQQSVAQGTNGGYGEAANVDARANEATSATANTTTTGDGAAGQGGGTTTAAGGSGDTSKPPPIDVAGGTKAPPADARRTALYDELMKRSQQSLAVDGKDPVIAGQVNSYRAEQLRGARNAVDASAEAGGPMANLSGERRLANEHAAQSTGALQSQLIGNEMQSRRNEIAQALAQRGGMLSEDEQHALQRQLAALDANLAQRGQDIQHGLGQAGLQNEMLRAMMQDKQFYAGEAGQNRRFDAGLSSENDRFNRGLDSQRNQFDRNLNSENDRFAAQHGLNVADRQAYWDAIRRGQRL